MSRPGPLERIRQSHRLVRSEGGAAVAARLRRRASNRLAPPGRVPLPVSLGDLVRASEVASSGWALPAALPVVPGAPLTVAWVSEPTSGQDSGGHTTMFRQVEALERAGHRCVVYFTDRHGWSVDQHRENLRAWWPSIRADVRDAAQGIEDAHAIFATSWTTAYPVLASPARGARLSFVQDFEPWFYPAGSEALLAEATYRFGFHGVTAGRWLAEKLTRDYGMSADPFEFGCDLEHYRLDVSGPRTGICCYARTKNARRALELGLVALEIFHGRHPEVDIHLFGDSVKRLPFPAVDHGTMRPSELNALYNRCVAGLVLSATNVSLVPHEMLAGGCVPVVNEAEHNRIVLDNAQVVYAEATPFEIADALAALVERTPAARASGAAEAAASVSGRSWADAGRQVERAVRAAVFAAAPVEV